MLVGRFHRIVNIELRSLTQDMNTKEYKPVLTKGQVIDCDFVGQGSTLDKRHFAVIWAADRKSEHIIVIPLTSKDRSGKAAPFSLGVIDALNPPGEEKDSIAKVNQPQSISRRSVHILTKKTDQGKRVPLCLDSIQLQKLNDIFRKYHLKEPLLRDVLDSSIGFRFPTTKLSVYRYLLNRPVQHVLVDDQLLCKAADDSNWTVIELVKIRGMNTTQRKGYLKGLFSGDPSREETVEIGIHELLSLQRTAAAGQK
jgi:uncharacterized protein YifN (PemK superfamily)